MLNEVLDEMKKDMEKSLAAMKLSLQKVRTGRASIGILDGIMVDYYGTITPLKQLATLAVPEPRLITIAPWDKAPSLTSRRPS
jgi:ribosome recycling factor